MDKLAAEVNCPNCETALRINVEDMIPGTSRSCPSCGATIRFTGDDGRRAQRALDDLERTVKDLNRRLKF